MILEKLLSKDIFGFYKVENVRDDIMSNAESVINGIITNHIVSTEKILCSSKSHIHPIYSLYNQSNERFTFMIPESCFKSESDFKSKVVRDSIIRRVISITDIICAIIVEDVYLVATYNYSDFSDIKEQNIEEVISGENVILSLNIEYESVSDFSYANKTSVSVDAILSSFIRVDNYYSRGVTMYSFVKDNVNCTTFESSNQVLFDSSVDNFSVLGEKYQPFEDLFSPVSKLGFFYENIALSISSLISDFSTTKRVLN